RRVRGARAATVRDGRHAGRRAQRSRSDHRPGDRQRRHAAAGVMEARLQRRVQRYGWDRAETYEEDWRAAIAPAHDRLLARAALAPGERVLDVACGTGLLSLRAAALVRPGGSVTAVDLSDRMVERTRERAAAAGVPGLELRS